MADSPSVRNVTWALQSSTHPDNHYGRLKMSFDQHEVSIYVKNEQAFEIHALLQAAVKAAYKAGINDCTRRIDALYMETM